jgi:hypothetical protein
MGQDDVGRVQGQKQSQQMWIGRRGCFYAANSYCSPVVNPHASLRVNTQFGKSGQFGPHRAFVDSPWPLRDSRLP